MTHEKLLDYQNKGLTVWETTKESGEKEIIVLRMDEQYCFSSTEELDSHIEAIPEDEAGKRIRYRISKKSVWKPYRGNLQPTQDGEIN